MTSLSPVGPDKPGSVSVVIPARNEEDRIADTVRAAGAIPGVVEVVVVDDGSCDRTSERGRAAGAKVVTLARRRGKGAAMARGLVESVGDIILFLDADLGGSASLASALVEPVAAGACDVSVARFAGTAAPGDGHPTAAAGGGSRRAAGAGGFGFVRWLARFVVRLLAGADVPAAISGQRALKRGVAERLMPLAPGYGVEVGMTVDALRAGMRLREVVLHLEHRVTGRDAAGFLHRARQAADILRAAAVRSKAVRR